jgi:type I restriction enzyme S subunit
MRGWRTSTLGEICQGGGGFIKTGPFGSQLHRSDYTDDPNGIPVVMPKDMARGRIVRTSIARIDEPTAQRLSAHLLAANDIVLSRRGDVGRSAWVFADDLPAFCGTGSMRVHLGAPEDVRAEYLRFFFQTTMASDYLEAHAVGSTMPNLNAGIVRRLPVLIPPVAVQDSLIQVLEAFDDLIENNRLRAVVVEEMVRAIYQEWFVRFRYPGNESVPLVDSRLGPIPKGWDVMPASMALTVGPRVKADKNAPHPFMTMGDLDEGMVCYPSETRIGNAGTKFQNGDTLFARITPSLENGKTGFVQSLTGEEVGLGSTEFIVLRGSKVGPAFTYCLARTEDFRANAIASMVGASGRQRVRNECFEAFALAVPPVEVANSFEALARPMFQKVDALHREAARLATLRDLLLPKLMSGQIDLSGLDLDTMLEVPAA